MASVGFPVLVSTIGLLCVLQPVGRCAQATVPQVFAHYYSWWSGDKPDFPLRPAGGWYSNQFSPAPPDIYERQILQARSAGITGFCFEWCGRRSAETRILMERLIPANNALPPGRRMKYLLCFDSTIWAMSYHKVIKNWYDPIVFTPQLIDALADEFAFIRRELPRLDPGFRTNYLHIDGRPAVFVYNAHGYSGEWEQAVAAVRRAGKSAGGLYLIGDFEVSPSPMFDHKRKEDYPRQAALFDAVSNYTLFNGYREFTLHEYIAEGRLGAALANGRMLAASTISKTYYPGIIAQYFKSRPMQTGEPSADVCPGALPGRAFVQAQDTGFAPIYRPAGTESPEVTAENSRCVLQALLASTFQSSPKIVFVTSWNEPYEGTMIEPSDSPNPACFVMGTTFLDLLRRFTGRERGGRPRPVDINLDGRVDDRDRQLFEQCVAAAAGSMTAPRCLPADLDADGRVDDTDLALFNSNPSTSRPTR